MQQRNLGALDSEPLFEEQPDNDEGGAVPQPEAAALVEHRRDRLLLPQVLRPHRGARRRRLQE